MVPLEGSRLADLGVGRGLAILVPLGYTAKLSWGQRLSLMQKSAQQTEQPYWQHHLLNELDNPVLGP